MVEYVLAKETPISRLALAVVAGTLESLIEATPSRIGHTYLRDFHRLVHPPGHGAGASVYYTRTTLTPAVREELRWWLKLLEHDVGRRSRSPRSATLVPTYGDGSGTGTGGTLALPSQPLEMWMGQWSPVVFKFTSNWKELKTLHVTLRQLRAKPRRTIAGTTIFYFTDNSTTYWICQSGSSTNPDLHALIREIRLLELELDISLQVIHIPGVCMITQGTDGLSRGVWMSPYHHDVNQRVFTAAIFAPLRFDSHLVNRVISRFGLPRRWRHHPWDRAWIPHRCFDRLNVWFPPPEVARQCIIFMLETWVEQPWTTSGLFFVPRTLSHMWDGLSRHLTSLGSFKIKDLDLASPPLLPIPVVVLYLPNHHRVAPLPRPRRRMDKSAYAADFLAHETEADYVRSL